MLINSHRVRTKKKIASSTFHYLLHKAWPVQFPVDVVYSQFSKKKKKTFSSGGVLVVFKLLIILYVAESIRTIISSNLTGLHDVVEPTDIIRRTTFNFRCWTYTVELQIKRDIFDVIFDLIVYRVLQVTWFAVQFSK